MRLVKVTESKIYYIETDEEEYNCYIRHCKDSYSVLMGCSYEEHYDYDGELEKLFQERMNT